jgi:DNA modification methylase
MSDHHIIQGDVMDGLRSLPDNCVQCTVTSPPYYNLRNYKVEGQIGLEETPEQFIQKMVEVFHEVKRVTRDDGVLFLNLGDSYSGSGKGPTGSNGIQNSENGLKPKDLMGIPWRCAFALQADGWYFRSAMPWIKRSCMPESTTDRPTSAIEYIFLMTKSAKYFYDGEAIRVPSTTEEDRPFGCYRTRGYNGKLNIDENAPPQFKKKVKKQDQTGNPTYTGFNERYKQKNLQRIDGVNTMHIKRANGEGESCDGQTRNYRNSDPFFESWQGLYSEGGEPLALIVNPQARPELHFASFPDKLAETFIKAGTSEYGCCPKCGAPYRRIVDCSGGTTGKSWHPHADDGVTGQIGGMPTDGYKREFKGWKPGCDCIIEGPQEAALPVPCLVLDPFMGSGTVAVVARELNRSSVGCELNPEYVKIIKERLQSDSCLDTGTVNYRFEKVPPP